MYTVGLTGGIGSGKSTVATLFSQLGVPIIDADVIARQLCEPGLPGYQKIVAHFGNHLLQKNGHIDRRQLSQLIFSQPLERRWLESLLHPLIRQAMQQEAATFQTPYVIFMIPLLTETKQFQGIDRILVVDTPEALQIKRATSRDRRSIAAVKAIMATQNTPQARLQYADDIIINDTDLDTLAQKVTTLHTQYLRDLDSK